MDLQFVLTLGRLYRRRRDDRHGPDARRYYLFDTFAGFHPDDLEAGVEDLRFRDTSLDAGRSGGSACRS